LHGPQSRRARSIKKIVDDEFTCNDILTNCRLYPKDEAPAAYKDFNAVLDSVKAASRAR
jgi:tRNA-splicing ligase RtcB